MKERGWRVRAIEKNVKARAFAKEHFDLDVDAEDALAGYADHSFDAITPVSYTHLDIGVVLAVVFMRYHRNDGADFSFFGNGWTSKDGNISIAGEVKMCIRDSPSYAEE